VFYTYVYKDPRPTKNQQAVYVGKGTGRRAWQHWEKGCKHNPPFSAFLSNLRKRGFSPIIEVGEETEDVAEAFFEEMRLVALYGRRDLGTGTLFNHTAGGDGLLEVIRTGEWSVKISEAMSTPEQQKRQSDAARARWSDPTYREKTTQAIRKALQDPEVIRRREIGKDAFIHTEEFRQTMSAATRKMWEDAEYRETVLAAQLAGQHRPEVLAKKSKNSKKLWAEQHEKMSASIKAGRSTEASRQKTREQGTAQWNDPEYRKAQTERNRAITNSPEYKAARKALMTAKWADPEFRAKMAAAQAAKKATKQTP